MSGGEILFLAHRMPFPADRGDKIRSAHLLRALAALAPVHVGTLADPADCAQGHAALAAVAASHRVAPRTGPLWRAGAQALLTSQPVSLTAFASADLREWIAATIAARPIDTIFVFSGQMGQYVPADFAGRVVIDLCDVDSAKFEAYGLARRGPRGWIDRREARLLAREEARLARRADATILISAAEAALFRSRLGGARANIAVIGNGIDCTAFDPAAAAPHPALAGGGPHCVFTGQMDYAPNVAAVERMARAIMPRIRLVHPQAQFHIVGRAPAAGVRALDGVNGTRVWGAVPDVRPFLADASVVVAPLAIARGVQNKVLEAMAMARPVVLTSGAATGIAGVDGEHFAIADSDEAFAARTLALLADPRATAQMGRAARGFVHDTMSWRAALAPLAPLVGRPAAPGLSDAA